MDRATISTHLQRLGLTEPDVRTYLAALEQDGGATTAAIASETGLDERDVIDVGRRLAARHFVTFEPEDGERDGASDGDENEAETDTQSTIDPRPPETVLESIRSTVDSLEMAFDIRAEIASGGGNGDASGSGPRARARTAAPFDAIETRTELLECLDALIDSATEEVALSIPASVLDDLEGELRDAVGRDVLVTLLVGGDEEFTAARFEGIASVTRVWSREAPVIGIADYSRGIAASNEMLADRNETSTEYGILIDHRPLAFVLMGSFFGNYWRIATQLFATDPDPLPQTYTNMRQAVFQATLRLEAGTDVHVSAEARPVGDETFDTVEGRLVDVRQSLLEPVHETFAIENALIVDREDVDGAEGERITLGGEGAFVEELQTRSVRLSAVDDT